MLGIVIPHYKNPEQLKRCLQAVDDQTSTDFIVSVQDNNGNNRGFTRACNDGVKGMFNDCDYFLILNQDCYLEKNAVKNIVDFMDKNPKCGIAGLKQLKEGNPDYIIHGGCTQAFPHGRHLGGYVSKGDCNKNEQMPWVNGACLIARKSMIIEIGLMDENFFLICSDSDWCYTARLRGWEVWYVANASCLHEGGVSSKAPDEKVSNRMKLDTLFFREKWINDGTFRELSMEIF